MPTTADDCRSLRKKVEASLECREWTERKAHKNGDGSPVPAIIPLGFLVRFLHQFVRIRRQHVHNGYACHSYGYRLPQGHDITTGTLTPIPTPSEESQANITSSSGAKLSGGRRNASSGDPAGHPTSTAAEAAGATMYQPADSDQTSYVPALADDAVEHDGATMFRPVDEAATSFQRAPPGRPSTSPIGTPSPSGDSGVRRDSAVRRQSGVRRRDSSSAACQVPASHPPLALVRSKSVRRSEPAITSSVARRRRHGRGVSGVGCRAGRRRRDQGHSARGRWPTRTSPRTSSVGSSASCCSRVRSPTRTSSAFTTSARSTASSTSRCRTSTASISRRSSSARPSCLSTGAADRARHRLGPGGGARRGRRASRSQAGQHHVQADGEPRSWTSGSPVSSGEGGASRAPRRTSGPGSAPCGRALASDTMAGVDRGHGRVHGARAGQGEPVDQRADVYAFGLILYDLLVGASRANTPIARSPNCRRGCRRRRRQ